MTVAAKVRISETVEVSWTETRLIGIGHHPCSNCGADSPRPTSEQLLDYAQLRPNGDYLWPGADSHDAFMPAGWSWDRDRGILCTDWKNEALDARRKR